MVATGRTVYVKSVVIATVTLSKAISFDFDESGTRITTAEDDDVYMTGQHVHSVDVTGSCVCRDTASAKAAAAGVAGTVAATLGDEDGSTNYTVAVTNVVSVAIPRSQPYGAWGETTLSWGAISSDGSTSPVSIT